jgi:GNAT superfamily N-acetyltransferase
MTQRRFDPNYTERAVLKDGSEVLFRLVRPEDKDELAAGLKRMSPESRYRRFFSHRDHLTEAELRYLTEVDHEDHFALGAGLVADGRPPVGVGVARFVRLETRTLAEAAVAVVDDMHGKGLGRMLFERMIVAARERGIACFRFEVLAQNDDMLGLIKRLFPDALPSEVHGDGVLVIDCPLPALHTESATHILYDILRYAAEDGLRVLRRLLPAGLGRPEEPPEMMPLPDDELLRH